MARLVDGMMELLMHAFRTEELVAEICVCDKGHRRMRVLDFACRFLFEDPRR